MRWIRDIIRRTSSDPDIVLSPSTTDIDRREKLLDYRSIESLQEYAIVYQDERTMEIYRRNADRSCNVGVYTADCLS